MLRLEAVFCKEEFSFDPQAVNFKERDCGYWVESVDSVGGLICGFLDHFSLLYTRS